MQALSQGVAKSVGMGPHQGLGRDVPLGDSLAHGTQDRPHAARFLDQSSLPQFPYMRW